MTTTRPAFYASVAVWTVAAALLLLPAIAMEVTREVRWTAPDFAVWATLLTAAASGFELLQRRAPNRPYRLAAATALGTAFLLVWTNLAVGLIGSENDDANLLYAGVLVVATGGACLARLNAHGMARAMTAAAAAQVAIGAAALLFGWGSEGAAWPRDVIGATALFTLLWLAAAWLFRRAAGLGTRAS